MMMNGHKRAADGITDQDLDEFLAKLNRELTPRMRRWAIALEMIENGYWPQDPEFSLLDGALDVVLAIRDDAMNGLWLSLKLYSPEERERQLDEMAKSPVLRQWLTLYRSNIARAEETKRKWAERKAAQSRAASSPTNFATRSRGRSGSAKQRRRSKPWSKADAKTCSQALGKAHANRVRPWEGKPKRGDEVMALYKMLQAHSIGCEYYEAGSVASLPADWVPTPWVEPFDTEALNSFYAAGPTQRGGGGQSPIGSRRQSPTIPRSCLIAYWVGV